MSEVTFGSTLIRPCDKKGKCDKEKHEDATGRFTYLNNATTNEHKICFRAAETPGEFDWLKFRATAENKDKMKELDFSKFKNFEELAAKLEEEGIEFEKKTAEKTEATSIETPDLPAGNNYEEVKIAREGFDPLAKTFLSNVTVRERTPATRTDDEDEGGAEREEPAAGSRREVAAETGGVPKITISDKVAGFEPKYSTRTFNVPATDWTERRKSNYKPVLVLHETVETDQEKVFNLFTNPKDKDGKGRPQTANTNIVVNRKGEIFRFVAWNKSARAVGHSALNNEKLPYHRPGRPGNQTTINDFAGNIELMTNPDGKYTDEQVLTAAYIAASTEGLELSRIKSHADVSISGKEDPRNFPWEKFKSYYAQFKARFATNPPSGMINYQIPKK